MTLSGRLLAGVAAGAAGTTALNAVTYLDMAIRGRGTSSAPEDTVEALVTKAGGRIPGEGETRDNRVAGLGPLSGILVGVGIGAALGAVPVSSWRDHLMLAGVATGLGAMVATDGSMAALAISDPRTWKPADWASDAVPHLIYGLTVAAVARGLVRD